MKKIVDAIQKFGKKTISVKTIAWTTVNILIIAGFVWVTACNLSTISVRPYAIMARTADDDIIHIMNGGFVGSGDHGIYEGDTYHFMDSESDHDFARLKSDDNFTYEDYQSGDTIVLQRDTTKYPFETQATYYDKEAGYNYDGDGRLMFFELNFPRAYSYQSNDGYTLRGCFQIHLYLNGVTMQRYTAMMALNFVVMPLLALGLFYSEMRLYRIDHPRRKTQKPSLNTSNTSPLE